MPTAEELAYIGAFTGAVIGIAAVAGLIWLAIKKFWRLTEFIDSARDLLTQAAGRPATRDDPGEPGLMERLFMVEKEQRALRETVDSLVEWQAGHRGRPPETRRRGGGRSL